MKLYPGENSCLLKTPYLNNSTEPTCVANIFQPNWPTIHSPPVIGIVVFSPNFTAFSLWSLSLCRVSFMCSVAYQHHTEEEEEEKNKLKERFTMQTVLVILNSWFQCRITIHWTISVCTIALQLQCQWKARFKYKCKPFHQKLLLVRPQ